VLTNVIVVLICFGYMAFLSWKLMLCIMGLLGFTLLIYSFSVRRAQSLFSQAMQHNDRFIKYLNEILAGFKEITIERKKGAAIAGRHMQPSIDAVAAFNRKALVNFLNNRIIGQMAFYAFIGLLLLVLGDWLGIEKDVLVNFVFLVLYVWGPIETVVMLAPSLSQAKLSVGRLAALEKEMKEHLVEHQTASVIPSFANLRTEGITYHYYNPQEDDATRPFAVGPIDFEITPGEIVFISGGNGSGKTTFINVLIGLYAPDGGSICLNGRGVERSALASYRTLFAPVFSDFYLFDELYGITDPDEAKAREYLELFELDQKVVLAGGRFSCISLSTGQRKRLALISAMLEKKPILILDEFAADQDPHFKRKFYTQILQYIRSEGFTIVAITHDDNYYAYADKLYKMEQGRLRNLELDVDSHSVSIRYE
jgi:putative ATP-binding cassette transporter